LLFHAKIRITFPSRNTLKILVVDYSIKVKKNVITSLKSGEEFFSSQWKFRASQDSTNSIFGVVGEG
jgi:hypothetical protein